MTDAIEAKPTNVLTKGGVVAYLQVDGTIRAKDFYEKAFGA